MSEPLACPPDAPDDPLARLAGSVATASGAIDPESLSMAMTILRRRVSQISPGLAGEADDIAADAVAKFVSRAHVGGLQRGLPSGVYVAYLLTVLNHTAHDYLRTRARRPEVVMANDDLARLPTDDESAAHISRSATAATVYAALGRARQCGDLNCFRIVAYKLNQIQLTGRVPSNRQTARASGVSHTTVAGALARFRNLLGDVGLEPR